MNEALSFIKEIWDFITSLIPSLRIVPVTHAGVKYVRGSKVKEFGSGIVWYWPIVTLLDVCPIVSRVVDLPRQTLTTRDGVPVVVGGLMQIKIVDTVTYFTSIDDADSAIIEMCQSAIRTVVGSNTWDDLRSLRRNVIHNALGREAEKAIEQYGVEVELARLTDLAKTKVITLVHAGATDGYGDGDDDE